MCKPNLPKNPIFSVPHATPRHRTRDGQIRGHVEINFQVRTARARKGNSSESLRRLPCRWPPAQPRPLPRHLSLHNDGQEFQRPLELPSCIRWNSIDTHRKITAKQSLAWEPHAGKSRQRATHVGIQTASSWRKPPIDVDTSGMPTLFMSTLSRSSSQSQSETWVPAGCTPQLVRVLPRPVPVSPSWCLIWMTTWHQHNNLTLTFFQNPGKSTSKHNWRET